MKARASINPEQNPKQNPEQNTNTNENENENLEPGSVRQIMDYIATYYILTMDFNSLRKLYDKEYCDKLVILTTEIIEKYFTNMEITYLAEDIKNGFADKGVLQKDKVLFFNKDNLKDIDIQDPIKKKRVCNGIAKFYIKIAHVFATILTTINPIYIYKDEEGNTVKANVYNKGKIPKDVQPEIYKLNICDNRINALKHDLNLNAGPNEPINVHPKICSFNIKQNESPYLDKEREGIKELKGTGTSSNSDSEIKDSDSDSDSEIKDSDSDSESNFKSEATNYNPEKMLSDEPGIPELMELYYDDKYDYETGKFSGMTEKTHAQFDENLNYFYQIFTDGKTKPENVKKFSDIKLREYHLKPECQGRAPAFESVGKGTLSDDLFKKYAENIKNMIRQTNINQELLLKILNKLFAYTNDPQSGKKMIRINPLLTEGGLQEVVIETREIVVKLYLTCESDFTNGIKLYEAIVEKMILETAQNQIKTLHKMSDKLVTEGDIPNPAETKELAEISRRKQL
jgi:hypothetical protein